GVRWDAYYYSAGIAAAFERLHGYSLRESLYLLDAPGHTPAHIKVRLDYYHTLNEGIFQAQAQLVAKARALFGQDILLGTHHTWVGEGDIADYRAGAVDYFRLNQNMDAGYTDNCWWDDASVCYTLVLAASLGRLTPSGSAECNNYHWKPTHALIDYYARLMTLMRVNWFNCWYGEDGDTVLYPAHYTWDHTNVCTRRHRRFLTLLGDAVPVADIAIWHSWEGVCGLNTAEYAGAHKAFIINTAEALVHRSIAFDYLDSDGLATARIENGRLHTSLGNYRVLIMPYAAVLPRAVWQVSQAFAAQGGTVIFVGPPPAVTVEGDGVGAEFAALLAMPELPLQQYLAYVDAVCTLPQHRPAHLDIAYPLDVPAERAFVSSEGVVHGVRNAAGSLIYFSALEASRVLPDLLDSLAPSSVTVYSDSMLWRLYREGDVQKLLLIATRNRRMRGLVRFAGYAIEISDGTLALLTLTDEGLTVDSEDCRYTITASAQ
ncbi:MAG TPA: hypothetical protein VGL77_07055, partial [Armatimonadota bacterium]